VLVFTVIDAIISSVFKAQRRMWYGNMSIYVSGVVSVALGLILIPIEHSMIYVMTISAASGMGCALFLRMRAS
jgi:hypothetical protein